MILDYIYITYIDTHRYTYCIDIVIAFEMSDISIFHSNSFAPLIPISTDSLRRKAASCQAPETGPF